MNHLMQIDVSQTMTGILIAAVTALSGVVTYLFRLLFARLDKEVMRLDENMEKMKIKLETATASREKSDLKALRAEIEARMPCHLPVCPKHQASFSIAPEQAPDA